MNGVVVRRNANTRRILIKVNAVDGCLSRLDKRVLAILFFTMNVNRAYVIRSTTEFIDLCAGRRIKHPNQGSADTCGGHQAPVQTHSDARDRRFVGSQLDGFFLRVTQIDNLYTF